MCHHGREDPLTGSQRFGLASGWQSRELYDKLFFTMKTMGTGLNSFDSWLALRSSKTLEVRVEKANSNAMAVAKTLEASPKV